MVDGRQYIAIAAGGSGKNATKSGDAVIAFALPGSGPRTSASQPSSADWITLFDGSSLDGWVQMNGAHRFTVEDGAIVGRTVESSASMLNPIAPISHHWMDATHISFGVVTAGAYDTRWKVEGSLFNGREPDENRADFDLGPLDSFSGRVTFLPTDRFALQVSAGHLAEAEFEFPPLPRNDINRLTASLTYHRPLGSDGIWGSTLSYGM